MLRTSVPAEGLDPAAVVAGYKNLANVERDFHIIKTDDLDLRPILHRTTPAEGLLLQQSVPDMLVAIINRRTM